MDEANGWQAGGNSYTVQFRDSCGMNKTGTLGLKKKRHSWNYAGGSLAWKVEWFRLVWVHWIKLGHTLERNKDRIYMHNLIICIFIICLQHLGVF